MANDFQFKLTFISPVELAACAKPQDGLGSLIINYSVLVRSRHRKRRRERETGRDRQMERGGGLSADG